MSISAILIAVGITLGTGSYYRFIYSYNLIMAATLLIMFAVIIFQQFVPIISNDQSYINTLDKRFSISGFVIISFLIFFPIFSDAINMSTAHEMVYFYIAMVLFSYLLNYDFRERILQIYLKIIVVLSTISIIFLILITFTNVLPSLSHFKMDTKITADFYYVFAYKPSMIWLRNQSIFFEPGAFGFHLIFATLLAYKNKNKLFIGILILTCLTTFSTTVFIFLILLGLYHIFLGENRVRSLVIIISVVFGSLWMIVIIMDNLLIPQLIVRTLVDKFIPSSTSYISYVARTSFTVEAFKMFLDNVFIGAGHYATAEKLEVVKSGATVNTSGFAGLLAELGLFGVFCIYLYTRYFRNFGLMAIPITIIWLNGEFLQYSPLAILILVHSADQFSHNLLPSRLSKQ